MTYGQAIDELLDRCDSVHISRECNITLAIGRHGGLTVIGHGATTPDALEHLLAQTGGWQRLTGTVPIFDDPHAFAVVTADG